MVCSLIHFRTKMLKTLTQWKQYYEHMLLLYYVCLTRVDHLTICVCQQLHLFGVKKLSWSCFFVKWYSNHKLLKSQFVDHTNSSVACLTRKLSVTSSNRINASPCFLQQETLPLLVSTGCFQEQIQAWFQNETKIN